VLTILAYKIVKLVIYRITATTSNSGKSWNWKARVDGEFERSIERDEGGGLLYKSPPEIATFYTTLQHISSYHLLLYTNSMSEIPHIFSDNFYTTNFYTHSNITFTSVTLPMLPWSFLCYYTHTASYTNRNAPISHDLTLTLFRVYLSD